MKNLLTVILIIASLTTIGQNSDYKLDSTLFVKINEYRISKGVNTLVWDTVAYKAAQHHAIYLYKLNEKDVTKSICTHVEKEDVGVKILKNPEDRYNYYKSKNQKEPQYVGECAANSVTYVKSNIYEEVANSILKQWQNSPQHNTGLLSQKDYGSVSSVFKKEQGFRNTTVVESYSSFILIEK
jgi:uncharacterized protein YkwD